MLQEFRILDTGDYFTTAQTLYGDASFAIKLLDDNGISFDDDPAGRVVLFDPDFIIPEAIEVKKKQSVKTTINYTSHERQSIYDIQLMFAGTFDGIFETILNNGLTQIGQRPPGGTKFVFERKNQFLTNLVRERQTIFSTGFKVNLGSAFTVGFKVDAYR